MAAVPGKTMQNINLAQQCQWTRQNTRYPSEFCALHMHRTQPRQGWRLAWTDMSVIWSHTLATPWTNIGNGARIYCNAIQGNIVSSFEKVDFLKLQNGSDIRGVAIAGVEGEHVNLTEPVTEAIAAAFATWLLNKKETNGSKRLKISVGHDSRISAQKLQAKDQSEE